jgi:hypothetical protein
VHEIGDGGLLGGCRRFSLTELLSRRQFRMGVLSVVDTGRHQGRSLFECMTQLGNPGVREKRGDQLRRL